MWCRSSAPGGRPCSNCAAKYGPVMLLLQLIGSILVHFADQADTMYRWSGSDQDFTGSNM